MKHDQEFWERWALGWRLLAALTLLVVGGSVAASARPGWPNATRFWILFALFAGWYALSILIGRKRLHGSLGLTLAYFIPGCVLFGLLIRVTPIAFALASILFPLVYSFLPTPRAIGFGVGLSVLMFVGGSPGGPHFSAGTLLGGLLVVLTSVMLALFIDSIIKQSEERKRLLEELEAARVELGRAERQAGVLEERQRLAQTLHDSVAQGFVGIVTQLEAAETTLAPGSAAAEHIAAAKAGARESLNEARRLVWELRPDLLTGEPLAAALARLGEEWSARTGIATSQVVTGSARALAAAHERALLQAAREGLANVRRHARAQRVTVTLSYMEDEVVLDLQDDGVGVGKGQHGGGGFGLRALTERVRVLGGSCALEGSTGAGATLTVSLPLGSGAA